MQRFDPPIMGVSPAAGRLRELIHTLSSSEVSVLITGESGVGKEVVARNVHRFSPRRDRPFVSINCAALAPGILESELFGHDRGAFTGAVRAHAGLFEQAHAGTLFLDEIGEIPPFIQAKLLRVLQQGEVRRMGEGGIRRVDIRLLSATNADLPRRIADGRFRRDLFYRINVVEIHVPPLRERPDDIMEILGHFFTKRGYDLPVVRPEAHAILRRYGWPGNVRELENELERIVALNGRPREIHANMFSERIAGALDDPRVEPSLLYNSTLPRALSYLEESMLKEALAQTNWNKSRTARLLGLSRQGLLKKIRRYGLQPGPPETTPDNSA